MKKISIAIADDSTMFRKGLVRIISSYDKFNVVIEAGNGNDLIQKLSEKKYKIPDICIIDINMMPVNGYQAAKEITEKWPDLKILALSMYSEEYCIIKMFRSGARGYLTKDIEPNILIKAIGDVYEKGFYHENIDASILSKAMQLVTSFPEINNSELNFLSFCCSDLHYKEIALKMNVSERTIDSYRDSLFKKLKIKTRAGLITFAIQSGLVHNAKY